VRETSAPSLSYLYSGWEVFTFSASFAWDRPRIRLCSFMLAANKALRLVIPSNHTQKIFGRQYCWRGDHWEKDR
jgi:hypothetical protein